MKHRKLATALHRAALANGDSPAAVLQEWSQILCRHLIDHPDTDWRVRRDIDGIESSILRTLSQEKK